MFKPTNTRKLVALALILASSAAEAKVQRAGFAAAAGRLSGNGTNGSVVIGEAIVGRASANGLKLGAGSLGLWIAALDLPTDVAGEGPAARQRFEMPPAAPNPFNPRTTIHYVVPGQGERVRLSVFDLRGRLVRTLLDAPLPAGAGSVVWDGVDAAGQVVASGTYLVELTAGRDRAVQKVTLVK
jgi:hypothetical protein